MACTLRRIAFAAAASLILSVSTTETATAQQLTRSMVESHLKEVFAAYASNDLERIVRVDPAANGFGYRVLKARLPDASTWSDGLKAFIASADYYRIQLDEMQIEVDANIGLAWGFYTEDFKQKGRSPERVRVRFTYTWKYDGGVWRTLLYHRDIQKFDEQGRYLRSP